MRDDNREESNRNLNWQSQEYRLQAYIKLC